VKSGGLYFGGRLIGFYNQLRPPRHMLFSLAPLAPVPEPDPDPDPALVVAPASLSLLLLLLLLLVLLVLDAVDSSPSAPSP